MTPELATGIIRYVVAKTVVRAAKKEHGKLWRVVHGITMANFSDKKVIVSADNAGPVANGNGQEDWVCFWIMLNKPTTGNDIIIREGKKVVMAHLKMGMNSTGVGGGGSTIVSQVKEIQGQAKKGAKVMNMVKGAVNGDYANEVAMGIYDKLNEGWRAGVWDTVMGTRQEFSFGVQEALIGGCAAFSPNSNGMQVSINSWDDKKHLMSFMGYAERKGLNSPAARKYVLELCSTYQARKWQYNNTNQSLVEL